MIALPDRIVSVLNWEFRQCCRTFLRVTGIQFPEFMEENAHRPFIGYDVMNRDDEHVVLRISSQQRGADKRTPSEIEWSVDFFAEPAVQLVRLFPLRAGLEVDELKLYAGFGFNNLGWLLVGAGESGAQGFVPRNQ